MSSKEIDSLLKEWSFESRCEVLLPSNAKIAFKIWLQFRCDNLHAVEDKRVITALIEALV
jgi:hypothetical protein